MRIISGLLLLLLGASLWVGCISSTKKQELRNIVLQRYPNFEAEAQHIIKQRYGEQVFKKMLWEWKYEVAPHNHEYKIQYGCFRDLELSEVFYGGMVEEITGELTGGFIKYNPKSENKGVYFQLIVNTKNRSVRPKK